MIGSVKEMMLDDIMAWDSEFHGNIQIENIEQVTHVPTSVVEHKLVGSMDSMSTLYHHASPVAKNPAATTHDARVDPSDAALGATSRLNVFTADIPNTMIHERSDFSLAESTAIKTFWSDIEDVKG
jgi:hypothetical protein